MPLDVHWPTEVFKKKKLKLKSAHKLTGSGVKTFYEKNERQK